MNPELISAILKGLPIETLGKIVKLLEAELQSRAPAAPLDTTYDALVQRFGVDGNAQLKLASAGHHEIIPQVIELDKEKPKYLLADLPFVVGFDNELVSFAFEPRGTIKRKFTKAMSQEFVPHAQRLQVLGDYEILIDPTLERDSRLKIRNLDSGLIVPLIETLEVFVNWYVEASAVSLDSSVPFYMGVQAPYSLTEFNGHSTIRSVEWEGNTFETAPYRTGTTINVNSLSNIGSLIAAGEVPTTARLEDNPTVTSVFVRIHDRLLRVMTSSIPYSRFVKSAEGGNHQSHLDLRGAINITRGMEDALGQVIEWTNLLGEEGLDLEFGLVGTFDSQTGTVLTKKGSARFFVHDQAGDLLTQLLTGNVEVLAYTLDGTIVDR